MTDAVTAVQRIPTHGVSPLGVIAPKAVNSGAVTESSETLSFSRHLCERIARRNLDMSPERLDRLNNAVNKASDKGARDSVVFLDELAVLVNVKSRTVMTAMDMSNLKDGVFTNIDSVVVG